MIALLSVSLIINSIFVKPVKSDTVVTLKNQINLDEVVNKLNEISIELDSLGYFESRRKGIESEMKK